MAEYLQRFTVETGDGSRFPIDMLRYDRCYPDMETDSIKVANACDPWRHFRGVSSFTPQSTGERESSARIRVTPSGSVAASTTRRLCRLSSDGLRLGGEWTWNRSTRKARCSDDRLRRHRCRCPALDRVYRSAASRRQLLMAAKVRKLKCTKCKAITSHGYAGKVAETSSSRRYDYACQVCGKVRSVRTART